MSIRTEGARQVAVIVPILPKESDMQTKCRRDGFTFGHSSPPGWCSYGAVGLPGWTAQVVAVESSPSLSLAVSRHW